MKLKAGILFIFLWCSFNFYAAVGPKEDSLRNKLTSCRVDTQRFNISERLFSIYIRKANFEEAKKYGDSLFSLSGRLSPKKYLCLAYTYRASYFYKTNKDDSAIIYNNKAIELAQTVNHYYVLLKSNINLGNIYSQKTDYKKAILYFQKAEHYAELSKDTLGKISTTLNLGSIFYAINDYGLAKRNFLKAIQMSRQTKNAKPELSTSYNNLATVFLNELPKQLDSAMFYYQLFLEESIKQENEHSKGLAYYNIAEVLRVKKEAPKALGYYFKAKDIFESMEDTVNIAKVLLGMSDNYILMGKNSEAITILKQGLGYTKNYDMQSHVPDFLKTLSRAYYNTGQYKDAYESYYKGALINDSIYNAENSEILYDLQTKYESNEKEKQNIILTTQNELSLKTIKQQRATTFFIIGGLILTIITAFFIFRSLRQQRQANRIISEQKMEVEAQKSIVDEKQKEILDSINYAKRIQDTLLAQKNFLDENIPENFVYFRPKDIVSGDFYWATTNMTDQGEELFFLACCDSTGHGVPGAFMSLLNIGFLGEAIKEKSIRSPDKVFNYVRQRLIDSISKEGQQDGFDGILLCINKTQKKITYVAANNSPVIISNGAVVQLPADKMPVGKGEGLKDFSLYTLDFNKGDMLYLYTDGYADQFGGSKGKKFKYKPLNELLLSIHANATESQKQTLDDTFKEWAGKLEQVDDVLIMGLKL